VQRAPAIEFDGVWLERNGTPILTDVHLAVAEGEVVALVGRSGAGKSSLLKLVNRLVLPTRGDVRIDGRSSRAWDPIALRRRMGYVLQEVGLFPHMSVTRNVAVVPMLEGWPRERTQARVDELLDLVGLEPRTYADRYPHELSGGQRQRVGIARALAADPRCILMDEPFGALDPLTRREVRDEFRHIQRELHKTVLFVTHDIDEAFLVASTIGVLEAGRLIATGTSAALKAAADPHVRALLGFKEDR
jgi:osmoprotectant transport system ATP-binding protein